MMIAQHKPFDFEKSTWSVSNQHNSLPLTTDAAVSIMSQNNLLSGCDMVKGGKPIVSNCISCVSPNPDTNSSIPPPFHIASDGRKLFRSACKARNVGPDHNEHTAYLLVPEDAPHGYFVRCSHSACVRTGRQFRYCVVCRRVATRRNFHHRHDHGIIKYAASGRPILPPSSSAAARKKTSHGGVSLSHDNDQGSLTEPPSKRRLHDYKPTVELGEKSSTSEYKSTCSTEEGETESVASAGVVTDDETLRKDELRWLKLLRRKPDWPPCSGQTTTVPPTMKRWIASLLGTAYPRPQSSTTSRKRRNCSSSKVHDRPEGHSFSPRQDPQTKKKESRVTHDDELLLFEDLDAVLGDFDKNLDDYDGDWSFPTERDHNPAVTRTPSTCAMGANGSPHPLWSNNSGSVLQHF